VKAGVLEEHQGAPGWWHTWGTPAGELTGWPCSACPGGCAAGPLPAPLGGGGALERGGGARARLCWPSRLPGPRGPQSARVGLRNPSPPHPSAWPTGGVPAGGRGRGGWGAGPNVGFASGASRGQEASWMLRGSPGEVGSPASRGERPPSPTLGGSMGAFSWAREPALGPGSLQAQLQSQFRTQPQLQGQVLSHPHSISSAAGGGAGPTGVRNRGTPMSRLAQQLGILASGRGAVGSALQPL